MATTQQLYDLLRSAGLPRVICLAFLGNWKEESGNEPNRLQGDFDPFRTVSKQYTAAIMDGSISRQQFMTDSKGYGLAQWTYHDINTGKGRKQALYDYWKQSNRRIDDPILQVNFAMKELREDFSSLYKDLLKTDDLYTAVSKICYIFENPKVKNVKDRYNAAVEISKFVVDNPQNMDNTESPFDEQPNQPSTPAQQFKTMKTDLPLLKRGAKGIPVKKLQHLLLLEESSKKLIEDSGGADGEYGKGTQDAVTAYQNAKNLCVDGEAGSEVWQSLITT